MLLAFAKGAAGLVSGFQSGAVQKIAQAVVVFPVRFPGDFFGDLGQRAFADLGAASGRAPR